MAAPAERILALELRFEQQDAMNRRLMLQIDDLNYRLLLLAKKGANTQSSSGNVRLIDGVVSGPSTKAQDWVWIDARASAIGPASFRGTRVSEIAFADNANFETIGSDACLRTIGDWAFSCVRCQAVELPASVRSIGDGAFANATRLAQFSFAEGSQLSSIGAFGFSGCSSLSRIDLPAGVVRLPVDSFAGCAQLGSVAFAGALTGVGAGAFKSCTALRQIVFPSSLEVLGEGAGNVGVTPPREMIPGASYVDGEDEIGVFLGCDALRAVSFGGDSLLREIGERAFADCAQLSCIGQVPRVRLIGPEAFRGCAALVEIPLLAVEQIGESAFRGCGTLTSLRFPAQLTVIGSRAFQDCGSLVQVVFASGCRLRLIGDEAFAGCEKLLSVTLPPSVKVGKGALPSSCKCEMAK